MSAAQGDQAARRRAPLARQLERLGRLEQRSEAEIQRALVGLELDSWELTVLKESLDPAGDREEWLALITEGVAFQDKCRSDAGMHRDDRLTAGQRAELHQRFVDDAAVGLALLEEMQHIIDEMVFSGRIEDAKRITGFRTKVGHHVNELKEILDEQAYLDAETRSLELVAPKAGAMPEWKARNGAPTYIKRGPSGGAPAAPGSLEDDGPRSRIKTLLVVFASVCVLWAIFILPRLRSEPMPQLGLADVTPRSEIRQVTAAPPSLFVEVDGELWREIPSEQRLEIVDDVGRTAQAAGYTGAHFRTAEGRAVAQWLTLRGSRLLD